jgi:hypothetical protein
MLFICPINIYTYEDTDHYRLCGKWCKQKTLIDHSRQVGNGVNKKH